MERFDWFLDDDGHVATLACVRMEELVVSLHWQKKGVQPDDLAWWLRPLCRVDPVSDAVHGDLEEASRSSEAGGRYLPVSWTQSRGTDDRTVSVQTSLDKLAAIADAELTGLHLESDEGVLIHDVVAERALGRPLEPNEMIIHMNGNTCNHRRDNLGLLVFVGGIQDLVARPACELTEPIVIDEERPDAAA